MLNIQQLGKKIFYIKNRISSEEYKSLLNATYNAFRKKKAQQEVDYDYRYILPKSARLNGCKEYRKEFLRQYNLWITSKALDQYLVQDITPIIMGYFDLIEFRFD